jgi:hypothetical protein
MLYLLEFVNKSINSEKRPKVYKFEGSNKSKTKLNIYRTSGASRLRICKILKLKMSKRASHYEASRKLKDVFELYTPALTSKM